MRRKTNQDFVRQVKNLVGTKKFEYTHYRDLFKNKFCKEHHIRLIRIKYTEDVNKVLEQVL